MFSTWSRSWTMVKASARVLRSDKELLLFPVLSALALMLITASFAVPFFLTGSYESLSHGEGVGSKILSYGLLFLFYLVQNFVVFYCNTALVGAALIRLRGGDPTLRDGFRVAHARVGTIFGYALISATVGMVLRMIAERVPFAARIIIALIGTAWSIATYLVIPVLAAEDIGPVDSVKRSARLLKQTWGEQLVGSFSIGAVFILPMLLLIAVLVGGIVIALQQAALGLLLVALAVLALIALAVVQAALSSIYSAVVYRYATTGEAPDGFSREAMASLFQK
jgi:hypothetical protein